jgi:hypothetical protein
MTALEEFQRAAKMPTPALSRIIAQMKRAPKKEPKP